MEYSVIIAGGALVVSAIGLFYKVGQDTKGRSEQSPGDGKLDQISDQLDTVLEKIDKIVEWQREATGIHESHKEQLKTAFRRIDSLEQRTGDLHIIGEALQKILERVK